MENINEKIDEIVIDEKETLTDKFMNFMEVHPFVALTLVSVGGIVVVLPGLAFYGTMVGKTAGRSAAKFLLEAGVKLA